MPPKDEKTPTPEVKPEVETPAVEQPQEPQEPQEPAADEPVAEVPQAPPHTAFMDHDDRDASANHLGVDIVRGDNGLYLVPLAFVEALQAHGFRVVSEGK